MNWRQMPRSYVTLAEHPTDTVRLACTSASDVAEFMLAQLQSSAWVQRKPVIVY